MLILPPGHGQTIGVKRPFRAREKWMLGGVLATVAALLVAVAISVATVGHSSGNGCVDVTIPYSTGGQELYRCGAVAREMCKLVGTSDGYRGAPGKTVAGECRKAGLPVGAQPQHRSPDSWEIAGKHPARPARTDDGDSIRVRSGHAVILRLVGVKQTLGAEREPAT